MRRFAIILVSLTTALGNAVPAQAFPPVDTAIAVSNPDMIVVRNRGWHNNGHGGHSHHNGHHHGNNYGGAILGGLAAGVLIGSLLNAQSNRYYSGRNYYGNGYYGGNAHERSCYARYRSYRAWDNTYQPY